MSRHDSDKVQADADRAIQLYFEERERRQQEERKRMQLDEAAARSARLRVALGSTYTLGVFGRFHIDARHIVQRDAEEFIRKGSINVGIIGASGVGKSCLINTFLRSLRETRKGDWLVPTQSTGAEGTLSLDVYLPDFGYRLVDTRGFYFFDDAESTELRNILNGRIPAYSRVVRQSDGREDVLELLPEDAVFDWERMHGIIIVISAVDPRVEADSFPQTFLAMKEVLRQRAITPVVVITHGDEVRARPEEQLTVEEKKAHVLRVASVATGAPPDQCFMLDNYTDPNQPEDVLKEVQALNILQSALMNCERNVERFLSQKGRNSD